MSLFKSTIFYSLLFTLASLQMLSQENHILFTGPKTKISGVVENKKIKVKTLDGEKHKGEFTIVNDSVIQIDNERIHKSDILRIQLSHSANLHVGNILAGIGAYFALNTIGVVGSEGTVLAGPLALTAVGGGVGAYLKNKATFHSRRYNYDFVLTNNTDSLQILNESPAITLKDTIQETPLVSNESAVNGKTYLQMKHRTKFKTRNFREFKRLIVITKDKKDTWDNWLSLIKTLFL